jgi:pimeloyl-ACP methyl ester carboxylesterase
VYDKEALIKGLMFLETANLLGVVKKTECETLVVHGRDDRVIPYHAGEALAGMMGAECKLLDGGHAFFTDRCDEVKRIIE